MKRFIVLALSVITVAATAQKMPHGMVFGKKPNRVGLIKATELLSNMGNRPRISTTVMGRINLVTKSKGGWFDMDAGHGQVITAHFRNAGINLPPTLKNHSVIIEGVAQKQMIPLEHGKHGPQTLLQFEVKGLEIE